MEDPFYTAFDHPGDSWRVGEIRTHRLDAESVEMIPRCREGFSDKKFFGQDFRNRFEWENAFFGGFGGKAGQGHSDNEIDFFLEELQFQKSGLLFVSLNPIAGSVVQPRRKESDPLGISGERVDIPADSVAQCESQSGSAAFLKSHGRCG